MPPPPSISFSDYRPGALGRVCELQAVYYARDWGFGRAFETKVARDMADFLDTYDPARDRFEIATAADDIVGSIAIDGTTHRGDPGRLRWFFVADRMRGSGLGGRLLDRALDFARERGFAGITLDTFAGLDAARRLYERAGFRLVHAERGSQWGTEIEEQRFELTF